jgi:hypothetical protein
MTTHEQLPRNCTQLARCSQRRQGAPGIGRARRCRAMSTLTALTSTEYNSRLHPLFNPSCRWSFQFYVSAGVMGSATSALPWE